MEHNKAFVEAIIDRMKTVLVVDSDAEAAKMLGGSRSMFSAWKNRGSIPIKQCIEMAVDRNISLDWLLLGRGSMQVNAEAAASGTTGPYVDVPLVNATTLLHFSSPEAFWPIPRAWIEQEGLDENELLVVRVEGDAMGETIRDGQLVIVDMRPRDVDGIYLLRWGDSVRFRRLQRTFDGSIHLLCDNRAYGPDVIPAAEAGKLFVVGYCHAAIALLR